MIALISPAVELARSGFAVFPLRPRDKRPLGRTTGLHGASTNPELARARWEGEVELPLKPPEEGKEAEWDPTPVFAGPHCNIGAATGEASGFWVLDEDGPEAFAAVAELEVRHGALPETVAQRTGNGRHRLFAWDPGRPVRNSAGKVAPKVDVRGEGGYIVAPPSIHPSGRAYAWEPGCAPGERPIAAAPGWLMDLAAPVEPEPAPRPEPRRASAANVREGRASAFGEVTLATSCRIVAGAVPGQQSAKLFGYAMFVGGYVAGGEIDRNYARQALVDAGKAMRPAGKPWSLKEIEGHVERGLAKGELVARSAPEPAGRRSALASATRGGGPTPAEAASELSAVDEIWARARHGLGASFSRWLIDRGLDPDGLPGARGRLRISHDGDGPTLVLPLAAEVDADAPEALAGLHLSRERFARPSFVGDTDGRVCVLYRPAAPEGVLVALDLADAWALGSAAVAEGWPCLVVLAPRLSTFAGGAMGDRFGRIDPDTPLADPAARPWTIPDCELPVSLMMRGDLRSPPLRVRKPLGGTREVRLEGEVAARFYAGLAEQHWRDLGANAVRSLRPAGGRVGFCEGVRR